MDVSLGKIESTRSVEKFVITGKIEKMFFSVSVYREVDMNTNKFWVIIKTKDKIPSDKEKETICQELSKKIKELDIKKGDDERRSFAERTPFFIVSVLSEDNSFNVSLNSG
jgi:hypothetical protein